MTGFRKVNHYPNLLLGKTLEDLDKLVNAEKEETVRLLQEEIEQAIKKAGEDLKVRHAPANRPAVSGESSQEVEERV